MSPGVQDQPGQHRETPSLQKIQKLAQRGGGAPVVPAAGEAEAGRSLEPRSSRPAWATWQDPVSSTIQKLAGHGGARPVLQEAELGGSLEPRRQRLQ